jgi:tyrosyl-tRNA synthetase
MGTTGKITRGPETKQGFRAVPPGGAIALLDCRRLLQFAPLQALNHKEDRQMTPRSASAPRPVDEQLAVIRQGTVDIIPEEDLRKKLEASIAAGEPLLVKQGFDPTAPDIHLGHTVGLRKLRQFQDLGHKVVFLVGDFTGMIGDPSGRSEIRKRMSREQLVENAKTYTEQAFTILDPEQTSIDYNSRWLGKMTFSDVLQLTATQTVAQMLERDDFHNRFDAGKPISLFEFIYPLAQGYDSVALDADVEIGGTDQTFNLLMARDIQRQYGQAPQVVLTLPLLEGIDGVEKMSKSLGNYIGVTEPPEEIFGKTMRIPDELIVKYFELVSSLGPDEVAAVKARLEDPSTNPSHVKRELARDLVTQFHDGEAAQRAESHFDRLFVERDAPDEMERVEMVGGDSGVWIVDVLAGARLVKSKTDARRMIDQGAVRVDGEKLEDIDTRLIRRDEPYTIRVGKRRFAELLVK